MKLLFTVLSTLLLTFNAYANQPLLTPDELNAKLGGNNLRILDIRDPKSYAEKHISGSLNALWQMAWPQGKSRRITPTQQAH